MLGRLGHGIIRSQRRNEAAAAAVLSTLTSRLNSSSRGAATSTIPAQAEAATVTTPAPRDAEVWTLFNDKKQNPKLLSVIPPQSLSLDENSPLRAVDPPPVGFSGFALKALGFYSKQSKLIRGSRTLYSRIGSHVDRPELYAACSLEKSFRTTHALLLLHVWMTLVRLRAEGKDGADVSQAMYELFNHDLEKRIVEAGVKMLISKWMKELEKNFYGAVEAYDEAMQPTAPQDALAKALWRNVYAEEDPLMPTGAGVAPVKALARYVRREIACLAMTDSGSLLTGNIDFSSHFVESEFKGNSERTVEQAPLTS